MIAMLFDETELVCDQFKHSSVKLVVKCDGSSPSLSLTLPFSLLSLPPFLSLSLSLSSSLSLVLCSGPFQELILLLLTS